MIQSLVVKPLPPNAGFPAATTTRTLAINSVDSALPDLGNIWIREICRLLVVIQRLDSFRFQLLSV